MPAEHAPKFPSVSEIRRLCLQVTRAVPEFMLDGHRVVIHDVRPNNIQVGHRVREHEHSFYEAHILLTGHARYLIGEEQEVGPGGVLLHRPHSTHAWQEPDSPCLRLLLWFSMEPQVPVSRPAYWPTWPDMLWDVALLLNDAAGTVPGWHHRITARLAVIVSRLLTIAGWPASSEPAAVEQASLIAVVEQFMRDNLARPITLTDIAEHVGVSQRTLCRQFLDLTGTTVMEHFANLRMDRAAEMLAQTDVSLAIIGTQVGMPDPSYFSRRFRLHFHQTPFAYRRQLAEKRHPASV